MSEKTRTTGSSNKIDLIGKKFGRWTVLRFSRTQKGKTIWVCRCECGVEKEVYGGNLLRGVSQSCGCFRVEVVSKIKRTHGASGYNVKGRGPLYVTWSNIRRRCLDREDVRFKDYGGRGIAVCARWRDGDGGLTGYECFVADMGPKPTKKHSVERKDVNGNYDPGNCVWATQAEQTRNKRSNHWVDFRGEKMVITDAIRLSGIPEWTVYERLEAGWSEERALTQPVRNRRWRGPTTRAAEKMK